MKSTTYARNCRRPAAKAKKDLGWVPEITLDEMVAEMVASDLQKAKQHALLKSNGYNVNVSVE